MSGAENSQPVKLDELYQEVILDHNRKPRNFKKLEEATGYAHGVNPLCGDDFELWVKLAPDGTVADVGFQGSGCAISKSSASLLTQAVLGKPAAEARRLQEDFVGMLTRDRITDEERTRLGRLKLFEGVKRFPVRVKCATLIWRALEKALQGQAFQEVTTETPEDRKRESS